LERGSVDMTNKTKSRRNRSATLEKKKGAPASKTRDKPWAAGNTNGGKHRPEEGEGHILEVHPPHLDGKAKLNHMTVGWARRKEKWLLDGNGNLHQGGIGGEGIISKKTTEYERQNTYEAGFRVPRTTPARGGPEKEESTHRYI